VLILISSLGNFKGKWIHFLSQIKEHQLQGMFKIGEQGKLKIKELVDESFKE
jgi:hypothetical protein